MGKTVFGLTLVLAFMVSPVAEAQKVYRIGALVASDQFVPAFEGFKKKMAELGYQEGKNIQYEVYNAQGDREVMKNVAEKFVRDKPDIIVTSSTTSTVPVAKATEGTNIPVVFLSAGDPLRFVKSYASSGNNLTGISSSSLDLIEKRMEFVKELVPGIKRVIVLEVPSGTNYKESHRRTEEAGERLGLHLNYVQANSLEEIKRKMAVLITRKLGQAVFAPPDVPVVAAADEIVQQAMKEKLPVIGANIENVKRGFLASYSSDYYPLGQQGAILVDKILKGSKPADLPIELPFKLKLVINLKTAGSIGLKIPKEILLRADEVIE